MSDKPEMIVIGDAAHPGFIRLRGETSGATVDVPAGNPDQVADALHNFRALTQDQQ